MATPGEKTSLDDSHCTRLDYSVVSYRLGTTLELHHARWLRGAVAERSARPEFHNHDGDRLIYHHPLVRYDVSTGEAAVAGLAEGAVLLRSLPAFEAFSLGGKTQRVLGHRVESQRVEVGPSREPIAYTFRTPYLALNQDNHKVWSGSSPAAQADLLARVVVGNLLSLSKAIGLHVEGRLRAEVDLEPDGWHEIKPGVRLLGFLGKIRVNYLIPGLWGIGKSSARGFGTVSREGGTHG